MPDWKGNQGRSGRGKSRPKKEKKPAAPRRGWRREQPADQGGPTGVWTGRGSRGPSRFSSHHAKLVAIWGTIITLLIAFVWFLILAPSPTSVYVVRPAPSNNDFGGLLAPTHFVSEDLRRLGSLDEDRLVLQESESAFARLAANDFDRWLTDLKFHGPGKCAVVYLVGHGLVASTESADNAPDRPVLRSSTDTDQSIDLQTFFEALKSAHPGRNKLVILDSARSPIRWELGQLTNQFPSAIQLLVDELKDDHLAVIVSHSDGQNATCVPSQQGSLFSRAFREALHKAGSGFWLWKSVSVQSLYDELAASTPRIVRAGSIPSVVPQLYHSPGFEDFAVVYQTPLLTESPEWKGELKSRFGEIDALWTEYQTLPAALCRARRPLQWTRLEASLIALERLAIAGEDSKEGFERLVSATGGLIDDLRKLNQSAMVPQSLALWRVSTSNVLQRDQKYFDADQRWRQLCSTDKKRVSKTELDEAIQSLSDFPKSIPVELQFLNLLRRQCDWESGHPKLPTTVAFALKCRDLSEQLAANAITSINPLEENRHTPFADVRLHNWTKRILGDSEQGLEQRRRQAEDLLIANEFEKAETEFEELLKDYRQAHKTARQIAIAYQRCDEVLAEAPWLAEWALARNDDQLPLAEDAIRTIHTARRLQIALAGYRDFSPETIESVTSISTQLASAYPSLDVGPESGADKSTGDNLEDIQQKLAFLQVPTIAHIPITNAQSRRGLHASLVNALSEKLDGTQRGEGRSSSESGSLAQQEFRSNRTAMDRISRLTTKKWHPAQLLLWDINSDAFPDEPPDGFLRKESSDVTEAPAVGNSISMSLLDLSQPLPMSKETATKVINELAQREQKLRAAAWLLARTTLKETQLKLTDDLNRIEEHRAATWLARRALDDFWGTKYSGEYSFGRLATSYLEHARASKELRPDVLSSWAETNLNSLANEIETRKVAAASLAIKSEPGSAAGPAYLVSLQGSYPTGKAALSLTSAVEKVLPTTAGRRAAIDLASNVVDLKGKLASKEGTPSKIELRYRGHDRSVLLGPDPQRGRELVHRYRPYELPKITVEGSEKQVVNVMLILDCSASMGDFVAGERKRKIRKIDAAKEAIGRLLSQMLGKTIYHGVEFEVGLIAYGHRMAWKGRKNRQGIMVTDFSEVVIANPKPDASEESVTAPTEQTQEVVAQLYTKDRLRFGTPKRPGADVELLVPLVQLSKTTERTILSKLDDPKIVRHWGQTPLYYSIALAADYLREKKAASEYHLFVLTDGDNRQNGSTDRQFVYDLSRIKGVLQDKQHKNLRLHIVGFDVPPEDLPGIEGLPSTNKAREGEFVKAQDQRELDKSFYDWLEANAKPPLFTVRAAKRDGSLSGEMQTDFGQSWRPESVRSWQPGPHNVTTQGLKEITSQKLLLEGWENITLYYRDRQLRYGPYEHPNSKVSTILAPPRNSSTDSQYEISIAAEKAVDTLTGSNRNPQDRVFEFVFQNEDATQQSIAPQAIWVEVTPLQGKQELAEQTYYFCDIQCRQGESVPLLWWNAPGWPEQAKDAKVQLWAGFSPEEQALHTERVVLNPPADEPRTLQFDNQQWSLDVLSRKHFQVSRLGKGPLMLVRPLWPREELVTLEVKRRYSEQPSHQFTLKNGGLRRIQLQFIDVVRFKKRAWMSEPTKLRMPFN